MPLKSFIMAKSKSKIEVIKKPKEQFNYNGDTYYLHDVNKEYCSYINSFEDVIILVKQNVVVFVVSADCGQNTGYIKTAKIL